MVEQNNTRKSCFQIKRIESEYKFISSIEHYNKYYTLIVLYVFTYYSVILKFLISYKFTNVHSLRITRLLRYSQHINER